MGELYITTLLLKNVTISTQHNFFNVIGNFDMRLDVIDLTYVYVYKKT